MKDFLGFTFGNIHTDMLHLTVVSSGSRYDKNLLPSPTDYKLDIPGGQGEYYFGQLYKEREFTINTAFDNIDANFKNAALSSNTFFESFLIIVCISFDYKNIRSI